MSTAARPTRPIKTPQKPGRPKKNSARHLRLGGEDESGSSEKSSKKSSLDLFCLKTRADQPLNLKQRFLPLLSSHSFGAEPLGKLVLRLSKSVTTALALHLFQLAVKAAVCPLEYDEECYNAFVKHGFLPLQRALKKWVDGSVLDASQKEILLHDQYLLSEFEDEIKLLTTGNHPLYSRTSFHSDEDYVEWQLLRLHQLEHSLHLIRLVPPFTGHLQLSILEAKDLHPMDQSYPIYPYVSAKIAPPSLKKYTKMLNKTSNPIWSETFSISPIQDANTKLEFKVYDKKLIGHNFLGYCSIALADIMWQTMPVDMWLELKQHPTWPPVPTVTGKLHVQLNYQFRLGSNRDTKPATPAPAALPAPSAASAAAAPGLTALTASQTHTSSMAPFLGSTPAHTLMLSSSIVNSQSGLDALEMINYPSLYSTLYVILYHEHLQVVDPMSVKPLSTSSYRPGGFLDRRKESSANFFHDSESDSGSVLGTSVEWDTNVDLGNSSPRLQGLQGFHSESLLDSETGSQGSSGDSDASAQSLSLPFERGHRRNGSGSFLPNGGAPTTASLPATPVLGHKTSHHALPIVTLNGSATPISASGTTTLSSSNGSTPLPSAQASTHMSGSHLTDSTRPGANIYTLPKDVTWLLDNFAKRWFVSPLYVGLANLDFLVKSFAPTNILHLEAIHNNLMEIAAIKKTEKILWDVELQLWAKTTETLRAQIEDCISNYFVRYPRNEPKGALSVVILIFAFLTTTDSVKLSQMLKERVEAAMMKMYKTVATEKPGEQDLIDACKFIGYAVENDKKYFNDVFPSDMGLVSHSVRTYYIELLSKNVKSLLRTQPNITENTMMLYTNLKKLHVKLVSLFPHLEVLEINKLFQPFVAKWLEGVSDQLPAWVDKATREEDWSPLSWSSSHSGSTLLHSHSTHELFNIITQIYTQYRELETRTADDFKLLESVLEQAIERYVRAILTAAAETLDPENFGAVTASLRKGRDINFVVPQQVCVWMSNVESCFQKLYDFCSKVEVEGEKGAENLRADLSDAFSFLKQAESQLISALLKKLNTNPSLELALDVLLSDAPEATEKLGDTEVEDRLEALFDYIGTNLRVLADGVDNRLYTKIVAQLWAMLLKDLEFMLFPIVNQGKVDARGALLVQKLLPKIVEFFKKNCKSLDTKSLESETKPLKAVIALLLQTTPSLIKTFEETVLSASNHLADVQLESHIVGILEARRNDKEAKKFVKLKAPYIFEKTILKLFDLPATERAFDCWSCRKGKTLSGHLTLTTNFICFDTLLWGDNRLKIPFKHLQAVRRDKRLSGTNNCITVILKDNQMLQFFDFEKVSKVYSDIALQAEKLGLQIETDASAVDRKGDNDSDSKKGSEELITTGVKIQNIDELREAFQLPATEQGIMAYQCAMSAPSKQATLHRGYLYIFKKHVCFKGLVQEVFPYIAIQEIEKKNFAKIIPNALVIVVKRDGKKTKHLFTSFENRDEVYDSLYSHWSKKK